MILMKAFTCSDTQIHKTFLLVYKKKVGCIQGIHIKSNMSPRKNFQKVPECKPCTNHF